MTTIISGSLAYDRIMDFPDSFSNHILPDKIHMLNVCFMVDGVTENYGGTAGNIAYAFKLMGGSPEISATIGKDNHRYFEWLEQNTISRKRLQIIDAELTAGAYITTDKSDNQITAFNPGAMKFSSNLDFDSLEDDALLIISPGNLDDMVNYPRICRERKLGYIFDPGQALPMLQGLDLINNIDGCRLLMVNDYELSLILDKTGLTEGEILERAGSTIVTLGDSGSTLHTANKATSIPVFTARQVSDPTGAGDAYRGGVLKGITAGKSLEESAVMGSVCASFAVENYGTQVYSFSREEFDKRFNS
jgi:adenosine kinase